MKKLVWWLAALTTLSFGATAQAAGNKVQFKETHSVAPPEVRAYEAGMKAFDQCLVRNHFPYRVIALVHVTGEEHRYSYVTDPGSWSDFDPFFKQANLCVSAWRTYVDPHMLSSSSQYDIWMPGMSNLASDKTPDSGGFYVVEVTLKSGHQAYETYVKDVRMIYSAMEKSKWGGHWATIEVNGGGPNAPNFVLMIPFKNFEDWGKPIKPPLWEMMANVYGRKKADELRNELNEVVKHTSSHYDAVDPKLSYTPPSHY